MSFELAVVIIIIRVSVAYDGVRNNVPEEKRSGDPSHRKYQPRRAPPATWPARLTAELSAAWRWWPTKSSYKTIRQGRRKGS